MKPKVICIVGETGSGKDTLVNNAIKKSFYELRKVCSYTDRPMRKGETDGVEHYFITTEEFNKLKEERNDDILAYTHIKDESQKNYTGYQYMALTDELKKSHIYIIDYEGLKFLKEKYDNKIYIVTVYIYASFFTRLKRAKASRSDFKKEFRKRVRAEKAQFKEFKKLKLYDYKIENGNGKLDNASDQLCEIFWDEFHYDLSVSNPPYLNHLRYMKHQKTNS